MDFKSFTNSIQENKLPTGLTLELQSLWYAGVGNWHKAHELIQDEPGQPAAHIHAYLHRVEGDNWNAEYWYRKAGEKIPSCSLEEEWKLLVEKLMKG